MDTDRRELLRKTGLLFLAINVNGISALISPSEARAAAVPMKVLSPPEVAAIESFAETLLPGAREAGIAHYIDHHLAADPKDSLLMLRYMDWPQPYAGFYKAGLAGLESTSRTLHGKDFSELTAEQSMEIVRSMGRNNPAGWKGIPAPLFYFVMRSDAVDVVYGTEEGFAKLGVPYMAHIMPPSKW